MKRSVIYILLLTFFVLNLCSCGAQRDQRQREQAYPYSAELKVTLDGREYGISAHIESEGEGALTFTSPSTLKGLKLTFGEGGSSLSYCGVKVPIDTDYASKHGILMLRDIMTADRDGFSGAKMIKRSGVSYCRERYEGKDYRIDVFFTEGADSPSFIEAEVGGRKVEILFVNNQ